MATAGQRRKSDRRDHGFRQSKDCLKCDPILLQFRLHIFDTMRHAGTAQMKPSTPRRQSWVQCKSTGMSAGRSPGSWIWHMQCMYVVLRLPNTIARKLRGSSSVTAASKLVQGRVKCFHPITVAGAAKASNRRLTLFPFHPRKWAPADACFSRATAREKRAHRITLQRVPSTCVALTGALGSA